MFISGSPFDSYVGERLILFFELRRKEGAWRFSCCFRQGDDCIERHGSVSLQHAVECAVWDSAFFRHGSFCHTLVFNDFFGVVTKPRL